MRLGLPGGHRSARNFEYCVDGSVIYSDPHCHTVELLDQCCHSFSVPLRLDMCVGLERAEGREKKILYAAWVLGCEIQVQEVSFLQENAWFYFLAV